MLVAVVISLNLSPMLLFMFAWVYVCLCVSVRTISWMANSELEQDGGHSVYSSALSELLF